MVEAVCATCGKSLEAVTDLSFGAPLQYEEIAEGERGTRATLTSDACTIDGEHFFVRGCLEIPVAGGADKFVWGVWVSLSQPNYLQYLDLFDHRDVPLPAPYFGWLSNRLPIYPDTLLLKTSVQLRPYPDRPAIELEPTDHPLAVHQREGIDAAELERVIHDALHGKHAG
jgi:hypothetical protein